MPDALQKSPEVIASGLFCFLVPGHLKRLEQTVFAYFWLYKDAKPKPDIGCQMPAIRLWGLLLAT
jgi:hypothetical protein